MSKKYKYVCEYCDSSNISFDTTSDWDIETHSFLTYDPWGSNCRNCGEDNCAIEKEIIELNINTKVL